MDTNLVKKLQMKVGQQFYVLNSPANADLLLASLPIALEARAPYPALLVFLNNLADIERLYGEATRLVQPDGLLWLAYPKMSSGIKTDINRDRLWDAVKPSGWRPVRQVALDDTWSALRFRPADMLGK
jgi:hypothetical protein